MKGHGILVPIMTAAAIALLSACAVEQAERIKIGDLEYGVTAGNFGGDWFDYYERGASYIEGALVAMDAGNEALMMRATQLGMADLHKAIAMRDEDQRRARTYGMHTIDYFPHRELGIGHYIMGNYEDARKELEKSLAEEESAKAQYFLDAVRKKQIERMGGDDKAPDVTIEGLPEHTKAAEVSFRVKTSDEGYISEVVINGDAEVINLATKSIEVSKTISIEEGPNAIEIVVADLSGNRTEKTVTVNADHSGPEVTIEETKLDGDSGKMSIRGWVLDPAGVKSIKVGDLDLTPAADGGFDANVRAGDSGVVKFRAVDSLGNETEGDITAIAPGASGVLEGYEELEDEGDDDIEEGSYRRSTLAGLIDTGNVMGPLMARWVVQSVKASRKRKGPRIGVKGLTGSQTVYFESFFIEGVALDPSGVTKLMVGRKNLMSKPGRKVFFNYMRSLRPGNNTITIVGRNGLGEASSRRIRILRRVPEVRQVGSRMSVSMLPFYLKGRVDKGEVAHADLLKYMTESGRFRMVDRSMIDKAIEEMKLSGSGLTDNNSAVRAGKIVNAETVLLGYVYENPGSIEVYARMVDVESGEILTEKDAYTREKTISLRKLLALMRGLSIKLRNQFPMVEGQVALLRGGKVGAKLDSNVMLKPGTKIIVYREKPVYHPKTKIELGNETVPVAEVRVAKTVSGKAAGDLVNSADARKIKDTDKVITK